ncbi:unnamed protein product [Euphydryas editha]|uniref:Gustatory receptor n=1 Tax=Euphydryas editha TaxID=104508 RepID=A0AAU9UFZ3_EUPED|nr:unnamed protein product [Euphydryas editha]
MSSLIFNDVTLQTGDYIYSSARILIVVIALIGSYTASERMSRMFRILKQLNEIETNLPCKRKPHSDWAMYFLMFITFLSAVGVPIITFTSFMKTDQSIIYYEILTQISRALLYQIMKLTEIQLITFAERVLQTLKIMNKNLELLISVEDSRTANVANRIRQLAKYNLNIYEIVRTMTKGDGYLIILLLLCLMVLIEMSWHKAVIWFSSSTELMFLYILPTILRGGGNSIELIYCTEVFHQTHSEMERTHEIVNYLKSRRGDEEDVNNELELFVRMLMLNKTTYSPLNMCTLSRPLVIQIFGTLLTYLTIILTYGTETNAPARAFENKSTLL